MSKKTRTYADAAQAAASAANQRSYAPLEGEWAPNRWAHRVWNHYLELHDDEFEPEFPHDLSEIKHHATDIIGEALQNWPDHDLLPNADLLASRVAELIHDHIHDRD